MSRCLQCRAPSQTYLCTDCTNNLADMLDQIPWLLQELDHRIQRLDRTSIGTIGRSRRPDELNVMDFDAAETSRTIRKLLTRWVTDIAEQHTGRIPPGLSTVTTPDLARWLQHNVKHIAKLGCAGKLYRDIHRLVGTGQQGGQLVKAINRTETRCFGPCTAVIGRDRAGRPRQCGTILYDDREATEITCPACKTTMPAREQIRAASTARDKFTVPELLETLTAIGEPVSRVQLYTWIGAGQLQPLGYMSREGIMVEHRLLRGDPAVYSLARAQELRTALIRRRRKHQWIAEMARSPHS